MRPSPISPSVDYDQDGVQHGFFKLPYSRDDWGLEITESFLVTPAGAEPFCTTPRKLFVKD